MAASSPDEDHMAELVTSSLPLQTRCQPLPLRQYGGFWIPELFLPGTVAACARFEPRPSNVVLASFPKSGTTWLKALAFATVHRADHPPRHPDHPLRRCNPHNCVDYLEAAFRRSAPEDGEEDVFAGLRSSNVFATHIPYPLLPARVAAKDGSGGRIVYICRDPKDVLVSAWFFTKKNLAGQANGGKLPTPHTIEEKFDLFCDGQVSYGPQWRHVAGYWEASQKLPDTVLFLRYEEMLSDPVDNVRKLAEFLGCAFSSEEETAGVVKDIVELCSIESLKNMEVNKNGSQKFVNLKNEAFFRKGVAGDWSNHMTPAMAERLDKIVEDALQGTGFTFKVTESV